MTGSGISTDESLSAADGHLEDVDGGPRVGEDSIPGRIRCGDRVEEVVLLPEDDFRAILQ